MSRAAQVSLRRWLRRQLQQPTPGREHLEAAVENNDPAEVRQQLLDARVAVLPRRVDCTKSTALWQVRIRAVVECQRDQCVPCRLVDALCGSCGVNRGRLHALVARERVGVGSAREQESRCLQVTEEARKAERVEAVFAHCVRPGRILIQQQVESLHFPKCRRFEDGQLTACCQPVCLVPVTLIQRLQQVGQRHIPSRE